MKIVRDGLTLCSDCMFVHETGGVDTIDQDYGRGEFPGRGALRDGARERMAEIEAGFARLGPHLVSAFDSETGNGMDEFSCSRCDCCGSSLGGARYAYVVLG